MNIGLSQRIWYHNGLSYDALDSSWYAFLKKHQITAIQNRIDQNFDYLADTLDSFIITGGNDASIRRIVEIKLATAMMIRGKPVLGICHGAFLLTELLGGTIMSCNNHTNTNHTVIIDNTSITVNSFHTLQITNPPPAATVLAVDTEGYCESWIDNSLAGIVWHPERMKSPVVPNDITILLHI